MPKEEVFSVEDQKNWKNAVNEYKGILEFLNETSDDNFFFYDFKTKKIHFTDRIKGKIALFNNSTSCSLEEWKSIIYPSDQKVFINEIRKVFSKHKKLSIEYRIFNRFGDVIWINAHGSVIRDKNDNPLFMVGRLSESALTKKADQFTGTFNIDGLKEELEKLLLTRQNGYLLIVGVDNLKSINIKKGWSYGNEILKLIPRYLEDATSENRVYRVNGDCFAAIILSTDKETVKVVFSRLQECMKGQCTLSGGCIPLQKYNVPDAGTLYQYAENSLDHAKASGKNKLSFFSAEDYEKNLAVLELKEELYQSVRSGFEGFTLYYQPQVYTDSLKLYGAEALLRFYSPRRGIVSPVEFIPILEETGLIIPVGNWVLETALKQCKKWQKCIPKFNMSVNMSCCQLAKKDIALDVISCLNKIGVSAECLTIEITESSALLCIQNINDTFLAWKKIGIHISVDDFGTGYSSLGRLKEMKVNEIKIDKCFVSELQSSVYNHRLISNMIELADSQGMDVCCEGIETVSELIELKELKPKLLQGYFFSKPCPPDDFEALYFDKYNEKFKNRIKKENECLSSQYSVANLPSIQWTEEEMAHAILSAENDIFYVSDLDTYELCYLNAAGRKSLNVKDYAGKKCYKILQGLNKPCEFCTNHLLKENEFYVWERQNEYSGRRYLLKDKLITHNGKKFRLEVAMDITNSENVSKGIKERLSFAEKVVGYTNILTNTTDYKEAVNDALKLLGEFYQADRAYLFELNEVYGYWVNTFEWCGKNVVPQHDNLKAVERAVVAQWIDAFQCNQSVIIYNLDLLQKTNPELWELLSIQDISRLIVSPLRDREKVIGFIGVDNPRCAINDDSQIRVLSNFLLGRMRQEKNEIHLRSLLRANYHSILDILSVGLWVIYIDKKNNRNEFIVDDTLRRILGLSSMPGHEECYNFWYNRISSGYYNYVNDTIKWMIESWNIVQMEYIWQHPQKGEVTVRCIGARVPDENGKICLKGYHRIISDVDRPRAVPDSESKAVFEYNDIKHTAIFHYGRSVIAGSDIKETNFPQSWIDSEIVHPHFASEFRHLFSMIRMKEQFDEFEVLLKTKSGTYEWFKISLKHSSKEEKDLDTVIVTAKPFGSYRLLEIEHRRIRQFYKALLSENVAYAEVDLESGQIKSIGGLWSIYRQDYQKNSKHFIDFMMTKFEKYLSPEDLEEVKKFRNEENWNKMFERGEICKRFYYKRMIKGQMRWVEMVFHLFRESISRNVYALIYLKDIHNQKERELLQIEAATVDPLTGVLNRNAFEREVCRYAFSSKNEICGVFVLLDVDNFKNINDEKGHLVGDKALQCFAEIIRSTFRESDFVGRLGGDEFMVFVKGEIRKEDLNVRMNELLNKFNNNECLPMTSSIGITYAYRNDIDYNKWLHEADVALYCTKKNGKNGFSYYDEFEESENS